jgi:putative RNA 2'-phosphotransferase
METMRHRQSIDKLSKLLAYILGRQPDEFGLLPDEKGFVKIKDLMKSLGEEPGWRHVRLNHIREAIYSTGSPTVEMEKGLIRAKDRSHLFLPEIPETFPKLLYHAVRQRAYPVLLEKGLPPAKSGNRIILANDAAMARRLGRRIDPSPVILTVNSKNARDKGAMLWRFGKLLFLSDCLPLGSFNGPPLVKKRTEPKSADTSDSRNAFKTPGSYLLDVSNGPAANNRSKKGSRRHKHEWKRDRKRKRSNKFSLWSDE